MKLRVALLFGVLLLCALPAFSQGCVMCYSSAAALPKDGQKAINRGVLVLLIPPVAFMSLGGWFVYRYSRQRDRESIEVPVL